MKIISYYFEKVQERNYGCIITTDELVEQIDKIAGKTRRTKNEIIQMCLEFAVNNL